MGAKQPKLAVGSQAASGIIQRQALILLSRKWQARLEFLLGATRVRFVMGEDSILLGGWSGKETIPLQAIPAYGEARK